MANGVMKAEWPARMQRLKSGLLIDMLPEGWELWLDGGHNAAAGEAFAPLQPVIEAEPLIEANASLLRRVGFEHHNTWMFAAIGPEQAARIPGLEPTADVRAAVPRACDIIEQLDRKWRDES